MTQSQKERERDERTRTPETEGEVGGGERRRGGRDAESGQHPEWVGSE